MATCIAPDPTRRRTFWATQPSACGVRKGCKSDCGSPGLAFDRKPEGTRIVTTQWVRGLAINMLLTNGRRSASLCGVRPGAAGGHWSESFIPQGQRIGTQMRYIQPGTSTQQLVLLAQAFAQETLGKLVFYGVAQNVTVTATYLGSGVIGVDAEIIIPSGETVNVAVSGSRSGNQWVWANQ